MNFRCILFALISFAACATDPVDEPPPTCPELGCTFAECTAQGECTCPQPDGERVACTFEVSQ